MNKKTSDEVSKKITALGNKILDCINEDDGYNSASYNEKSMILFIGLGRLLSSTAQAIEMKPEYFKDMLQNLLLDYVDHWEEKEK